jgi:glyoxylase-like metal-dependent hydrolase (beta-lactamase superfamily II)
VVLILPTLTFEEEHHLDLGGLSLELHALPGHTADCIVALIPERGVLLAGDTVETPLPLLNPGSDLDGWTRRLEGWAEDPRVELVVPAHGELGGTDLLRRTARYLRGLREPDDTPEPSGLDDFYRRAHRRNRELARAATS